MSLYTVRSGILIITGWAASMVVNALVTGMIVFRIHKVTEARPSTLPGGNKVRHIMFIIIESGMALFAIQLVRLVMYIIPASFEQGGYFIAAYDIAVVVNQMLNVNIIRSIHFYFFCFADNIYLTRESHQR